MVDDETVSNTVELDAVVVGAGWAGMYALIRLRRLGMRAKILEAGHGVGGTWYWNRYPGARCDVPSLNYSYSFDEELQQEWEWTERYAAQPEIERYANHVADRFALRPDIEFGTKVTRAGYDEATGTWRLATQDGPTYVARFAIFATGGYSEPVEPTIPGWETFEGETYFTPRWPQHPVDYAGKRVGVIGTGASGMQTVTTLAGEDLERLYVFQRTANYVVPGHNRVMSEEEIAAIKDDYAAYRERARMAGSGTVYDGPVAKISDLSDDEFEQHMRESMAIGGTSVLGSAKDLLVDPDANERVQEYLRREVRRRVEDPEVAEKLAARGHYLGARRVLIENGYLEAFNDDRVQLVDVRADPILEITPKGVRTASEQFDLDVLIFATGFDSGTGALSRIDIRGRGGERLTDKWAAGPVTYVGIAMAGFPNLFSLAGPGGPSIRSNVMVSIEQHVEWLADLLEYAQREDIAVIEATSAAETGWTEHVNDLVHRTILPRDDTQYWGVNVPGKPRAYLAYVGGTRQFSIVLDAVRDHGYEGFAMWDGNGRQLEGRAVDWSGLPPEAAQASRFGTGAPADTGTEII